MRLIEWLHEAASGPGSARFLIQPTLAVVLALRDGLRDARLGATPFLRRLADSRGERRQALRSAWATLLVPLTVAFLCDSVLQLVILGRYQPGVALLVAGCLVCLPYSLLRGTSCRLIRRQRVPRYPCAQET